MVWNNWCCYHCCYYHCYSWISSQASWTMWTPEKLVTLHVTSHCQIVWLTQKRLKLPRQSGELLLLSPCLSQSLKPPKLCSSTNLKVSVFTSRGRQKKIFQPLSYRLMEPSCGWEEEEGGREALGIGESCLLSLLLLSVSSPSRCLSIVSPLGLFSASLTALFPLCLLSAANLKPIKHTHTQRRTHTIPLVSLLLCF